MKREIWQVMKTPRAGWTGWIQEFLIEGGRDLIHFCTFIYIFFLCMIFSFSFLVNYAK